MDELRPNLEEIQQKIKLEPKEENCSDPLHSDVLSTSSDRPTPVKTQLIEKFEENVTDCKDVKEDIKLLYPVKNELLDKDIKPLIIQIKKCDDTCFFEDVKRICKEDKSDSSIRNQSDSSLTMACVKENCCSSLNGDLLKTFETPVKTDCIDVKEDIKLLYPVKNEFLDKGIKPLTIKIKRCDDTCFFEDVKRIHKEDESNSTLRNKSVSSSTMAHNKHLVGDSISDEDTAVDNDFIEFNSNMEIEDNQIHLTGSNTVHNKIPSTQVKKGCANNWRFVCKVCSRKCPSNSALRMHLRVHTGERPFICSFCKKTFRTKMLLKRHLQCHSDRYLCAICHTAFNSKNSLLKHLQNICSLSSISVSKNKHLPCKISIKGCETKNVSPTHVCSIRLKEKRFNCKMCEYSCRHKGNLKKHEALHENKFNFSCSECNMSFKVKGGLTLHIKSKHQESKPFICSICCKSFKLFSNLKIHHQIHHAEKKTNKYVCDICEMGFYRLTYLKRHRLTHSGLDKKILCAECGIGCRSKTDMARHVATHFGGGDKPFKCDKCEFAFSRSIKLLRHMLVHSKDKPFKCDLCTKAYKDSASLKVHKDSVHFKSIYICDHCGFRSTNSHSFKRHIRQKCKDSS